MGSIAMDDNGSIALCYAKSSSTVFPSLCFTGRLASDPLGTMSFAEVLAVAGDHVQTNTNRFGDYSHTALDPDGITFWHTGEYIAGANNSVKTRIYSFQLPVSVDIQENKTINELSVFPNPNEGKFTISFNSTVKSSYIIEIANALGQQVFKESINDLKGIYSKQINLIGFGKGVYTISLTNNKNKTTKKIVVN